MKRKNELEVLRVISMLMVLILHTLGHGGILYSYAQESFGYFFFWLIETFCLVAVNCFLLITGYVMLNAKFRPSRIIALILQTEFYSILCTLIVSIIFQKEVSVHQWILSFFPLTSGRYWFMSAYFIILIFFPMFNIFILSIDRGTHFLVNTGLILTFSVIPTILFWSKGIFGNGYQYTWFIVLYFIGAYYKKYKAEYQEINVKNIYYYILFIGGGYCSKIILDHLHIKGIFALLNSDIFLFYNSLIYLEAGCYLFKLFIQNFSNSKGNIKYVAYLGKYVLGAYLISDHEIIRESLWQWLKPFEYMKTHTLMELMSYIILIVLGTFILGILLEYTRQKIIYIIKFDKILLKIDDLMLAWIKKLIKEKKENVGFSKK